MTRVHHTGFEWQSVTAGVELSTVGGGGEAIDTTIKHSGSASLKCAGSIVASALCGMGHNVTMATDVYACWYIYIDSLTDNISVVATMDLATANGTTNASSIQIHNSAGTLVMEVWVNAFGSSISNTASLQFDTWHRIEEYYKSSGAAGADQVIVKVDGTEVANSSTLTLTSTPAYWQCGVYNGTAGTITDSTVYFDDVAINTTAGSVNNSWVGENNVAILVPTGAGDNAATKGVYSYISEIPPSNTATSGSTMVELDSNGVIADYNVTDSSTAGIDSYDTIDAVSVLARVREEAAGTSSYQLRIKSASGGTVTSTTPADAGNATVRTNPNSTTAFGKPLISQTDPTTGSAWTPTGTNSIDNIQIGASNVDADSTPDLWVLTMCAMVAYKNGTAPGGSVVKDLISGFIPFAR